MVIQTKEQLSGYSAHREGLVCVCVFGFWDKNKFIEGLGVGTKTSLLK